MCLAAIGRAETISFTRITSNAADDVAGQLSAVVSAVDSTHVRFAFYNSAAIPSSITDIYVDDGNWPPDTAPVLAGLTSIMDSSLPDVGTRFVAGAHPRNLPAGNGLQPPFSADWAAEAANQPPTMVNNGVNMATDRLDMIFALAPGKALADVIAAVDDRTLRLGLHVQGISGGASDSFVSAHAPEPAAAVLLLTALGAAWLLRRRRCR